MIIASFNAHKFYIDKQCLAIMLMQRLTTAQRYHLIQIHRIQHFERPKL